MANRQLNAKLIMCGVPTANSAAALAFYNTLLGGEDFARNLNAQVESFSRPIHQDGLTLSIIPRNDPREPITCYFAVDDLDQTVNQLTAAGGSVVLNSTAFAVSGSQQAIDALDNTTKAAVSDNAGKFATMRDPDGNYLALMQLDDAMQTVFNAHAQERMLSQEQADRIDKWKQHGEPSMSQ